MDFAEFAVRSKEADARLAEAENWKARAEAAESRLALAEKVVEQMRNTAFNLRRLSKHFAGQGLPGLATATRIGAEDCEAALTAYEENTSSKDLTTGGEAGQ